VSIPHRSLLVGAFMALFVLPREVPGMPALKDEDVARGDGAR
jgi:hypothetical protein